MAINEEIYFSLDCDKCRTEFEGDATPWRDELTENAHNAGWTDPEFGDEDDSWLCPKCSEEVKDG